MDMGITGRTALVLGASGGLGGAVALALAREGVNVALTGTKPDALGAAAARLDGLGVKVTTRLWDLSQPGTAAEHLQAIQAALGPIDILFNNSGGPPPSQAQNFDAAVLHKQFQAMVVSLMDITTQVLPGMRQRGFGRILFSTSAGVVAPIPNLALSNALRASLVGWAKTLSREVAADGVTVNTLIPGRIATPRIQVLDGANAKRAGISVEDEAKRSAASIPMGRYGEPSEYADAAVFLCSARAGYITGAKLQVDGGLLANV